MGSHREIPRCKKDVPIQASRREELRHRMENPRLVSFHGIYVKRARQELCIPTTFGLIKFKTSNRTKSWHNMESGEMSLSDEEEIFNQVEAYITHTLKWSMGRTTDRVEKLRPLRCSRYQRGVYPA